MADPIIKCYEDKLNPAGAILTVTTDKYTHTILVPDKAAVEKATEKIDVTKIVAVREKILDANVAFIAAKVSGKEVPIEIDYSKLVTTATVKP